MQVIVFGCPKFIIKQVVPNKDHNTSNNKNNSVYNQLKSFLNDSGMQHSYIVLLLLLVLTIKYVKSADTESETVDTETSITDVSQTDPKFTQDENVGQPFGLFGPRFGLNWLQILFPYVTSLINTFPAQQLLGAPLDSQAASSQVVLVLADDNKPISPRTSAKLNGRTTRQMSESSGDIVQQAMQNMKILSDNMGQTFNGSPLLPHLPEVPNLTELLSQTPIVGQSFGQSLVQQAQNLPEFISQTSDAFLQQQWPDPTQLLPQTTLGQSIIDTFTNQNGLLSQTMIPFNFGELPNNMMGAALERSEEDQKQTLQLAPFQPFSSTMLGSAWVPPDQGPWTRLFNLNPVKDTQLNESVPNETAASEMSEVRIKPDFDGYQPPMTNDFHSNSRSPPEKMSNKMFNSAMQDAIYHKNTPILWFRLTPNFNNHHMGKSKTLEDQHLEAKLLEFEHKIVEELQFLQTIQRQAKTLRAADDNKNVKTSKNSPYKLNYHLCNTPIHKITLSDLDEALSDEYVQKLLRKALVKEQQHLKTLTGVTPVKRQTGSEPESPLQDMTKSDVAKMMVYAYRMANANGPEMPWIKNDQNNREASMYSPYRSKSRIDENVSSNRQWIVDEKQSQKVTDTPIRNVLTNSQRNTNHDTNQRTSEIRQWAENPQIKLSKSNQRQWADQGAINENTHKDILQSSINRQWVNHNEEHTNNNGQVNDNFPRQWANAPQEMLDHDQFETNQKETQASRMEQNRCIWVEPKQLTPPLENIQRNEAEKDQLQHNLEMMQLPQNHGQTHVHIASQRQWVENDQQQNQTPETRSLFHDQYKTPIEMHSRNQMLPEQNVHLDMTRQMDHLPNQNPVIIQQDPQQQHIVGEAAAQMVENAGKARHKGEDIFGDLFGDDMFNSGKHKEKDKKNKSPTIINYYYNQGGGRYPLYGKYGPSGYPGNYGNAYTAGSYSGGYNAGNIYGGSVGYGSGRGYPSRGSMYGGGGYGSNAYNTGGGYRTASGNDEIDEMLRQHQVFTETLFRH